MGRPRTRDGLDQFCDWMRESGRCSPSTAKEYTSHVRRAVRTLDGKLDNAEAVNRFFAEAYETDHSYGKLRSGWTVFAEWNAEVNEIDVVVPEPVSITRSKAKASEARSKRSLPPDVRTAIRFLIEQGVGVTYIPKIRWVHVDLAEMTQSQRTHVLVPGSREEWLVSSAGIKVLWDWAAVGTDLSKPLVPREPGSHHPYSYSALREQTEIYTEKELEARLRGPVGSAVAGPPPRDFRSMPEGLVPDEDDAGASDEGFDEDLDSLAHVLGYDPNAQD